MGNTDRNRSQHDMGDMTTDMGGQTDMGERTWVIGMDMGDKRTWTWAT